MTDTIKYKSALLDAVRKKDNGYELASFAIQHDLDGDAPCDFIADFEKLYIDGNFEAIALLAIKYMAQNHHPHTTLVVNSTSAELLEGVKSTGEVLDYLKD